MKIVVAGYGPVGEAVYTALRSHQGLEVYIDDPYKGYRLNVNDFVTPVDGVVVCVATPMSEDGSCDTSNVEDVFTKYDTPDTKFLIKSAVDPVVLRDCANFGFDGSFTYSPEFLASSNMNRSPTDEFLQQEFAIFGGDDCRWWHEIFKVVLPRLSEVKYGTLEQASFAKYVENCFLATKVTFFNEIYKIYESIGFEGYDQMIDLLCLDPRIGRSHTQVPNPDNRFGYGGHCFPKDMAALRSLSRYTPLLDAVVDTNEEHRTNGKEEG